MAGGADGEVGSPGAGGTDHVCAEGLAGWMEQRLKVGSFWIQRPEKNGEAGKDIPLISLEFLKT